MVETHPNPACPNLEGVRFRRSTGSLDRSTAWFLLLFGLAFLALGAVLFSNAITEPGLYAMSGMGAGFMALGGIALAERHLELDADAVERNGDELRIYTPRPRLWAIGSGIAALAVGGIGEGFVSAGVLGWASLLLGAIFGGCLLAWFLRAFRGAFRRQPVAILSPDGLTACGLLNGPRHLGWSDARRIWRTCVSGNGVVNVAAHSPKGTSGKLSFPESLLPLSLDTLEELIAAYRQCYGKVSDGPQTT